MKKYLALILALAMSLSLVACGGGEEAAVGGGADGGIDVVQAYWNVNDVEGSIRSAFQATDGKIAIITNTVSQNEEEYRSAEFMVEKYGSDRVIHAIMPDNFVTEQEQFISIVDQCASDPAVTGLLCSLAQAMAFSLKFLWRGLEFSTSNPSTNCGKGKLHSSRNGCA